MSSSLNLVITLFNCFSCLIFSPTSIAFPVVAIAAPGTEKATSSTANCSRDGSFQSSNPKTARPTSPTRSSHISLIIPFQPNRFSIVLNSDTDLLGFDRIIEAINPLFIIGSPSSENKPPLCSDTVSTHCSPNDFNNATPTSSPGELIITDTSPSSFSVKPSSGIMFLNVPA